MKLQGKVAVVTGGLRGIGHAIAVALAQEGADLLIAGLSMDRAAQTEQEIRTLGDGVWSSRRMSPMRRRSKT